MSVLSPALSSAPLKPVRRAGARPASPNQAAVVSALRQAGLRATVPRVAVYHLLTQQSSAMDTTEIASTLAEQSLHLPMSSIYAALARFHAVGLVSRQVIDRRRALYQLAGRNTTVHLACTQCGRVTQVDDEDVAHLCRKAAASLGYALQGSSITVNGRCVQGCKAKGQITRSGAH